MTVDNKDFDVLEKRSKDYYDFFIKSKTEVSRNSKELKTDFNLNEAHFEQCFILPHTVSPEPC